MPTYHTGSVRYHVSEFLSDRHPYNPNTGFETQRQREAGLVKNSHESVALDKLPEDLLALDDPNEKVKALRALSAHAASAEVKIVLIRKGIVARLAATLMQARKRSSQVAAEGDEEDPSAEGAATAAPHIQQLQPFRVPTQQAAWCMVEQTAAQLLRSLCVLPQGAHAVIEEGGWTALIASVADASHGLKAREQARIAAATAISLLTSTGASLNWLTSGDIDGPKDMELEGYVPWDAFYNEYQSLYASPAAASEGAVGSSATLLSSPDAIGVCRLDSIDARERVLSAFFDAVVTSLAKDQPSPRLLLPLLDAVGHLMPMERCLHLALLSSILRALSSYVGAALLKDDLWLHASATSSSAGGSGNGGGIKPADIATATLASATAAHRNPGMAPIGTSGAASASTTAAGAPNGPQIDIASKIANILWHIGLDSVGKHEILELFQVVFQTGKLLQLLLKETTNTQLLPLKALVAGALGSMALLPDMKKMMTSKKDFPIVVTKNEESGAEVLNGNKDANQLDASFVDSLLTLLRQANALLAEKFPSTSPATSAAGGGQRLSIADTALKRDLDAVITNTVATLRLIAELPAARAYLHERIFLTNNPPVNLDGPALTIASAQEGREHELRRQLFYSTRWEKEFKVFVY